MFRAPPRLNTSPTTPRRSPSPNSSQEYNRFFPIEIMRAVRFRLVPNNREICPIKMGPPYKIAHIMLGKKMLGPVSKFYQVHLDDTHTFDYTVMPRIVAIQPYLAKQFPEITRYAESLDNNRLSRLFLKSERYDHDLSNEIKHRFGNEQIEIFPLQFSNEEVNELAKTIEALEDKVSIMKLRVDIKNAYGIDIETTPTVKPSL